jgi:hypothetical protein
VIVRRIVELHGELCGQVSVLMVCRVYSYQYAFANMVRAGHDGGRTDDYMTSHISMYQAVHDLEAGSVLVVRRLAHHLIWENYD